MCLKISLKFFEICSKYVLFGYRDFSAVLF